MKKIYVSLVMLICGNLSFAQFIPPDSLLVDLDSCKFETTCSFIQIDTSQQNNLWQEIGRASCRERV